MTCCSESMSKKAKMATCMSFMSLSKVMLQFLDSNEVGMDEHVDTKELSVLVLVLFFK